MKFLPMILIVQLVMCPFIGTSAYAAEKGLKEPSEDYYQCSMHAWIVSDKPGNCPVCGMRLTKTQGNAAAGEAVKGRASIKISSERQQMIGVTKDQALTRPLVYSVHSVGHVAYNPDLAATLAEYREAYAVFRKTRKTRTPKFQEKAMQLMELAELKVRLSGLSGQQIEEMKNANFDTRILNNFFAPEGLVLAEGNVWVDTDLYESDSELVKPGDEVSMAAPALPGKIFKGIVRTADPVLNEFPRKLRIRIETTPEEVLKAGMAVDVRIIVKLGDRLSVPETALLDTGHSQVVFVAHDDGKMEPRQVQTGQHADGFYEIISGLHEGERVITSATFLIDSESRLKAAAQGQGLSGKKAAEAQTGLASSPSEAVPAVGHAH